MGTKEDIIRKIQMLDNDERIKETMNEIYQGLKARSGRDVVRDILGGEVL